MTCQECEELSGAYALGALSEAEQAEAEAHLADCTSCALMINELQKVVNALPLAVPQIEPSPRVKARVMAKIQQAASQYPREIRRRPTPSTRWTRWRMPLVAAVAVLLLAFCGAMTAWNVALQQQLARLSPAYVGVQGTSQDPAIHGQITYLPQQNISILVMENLPSLQGTQVYQGWVLQGKHPTSIGTLNVQQKTGTLNVVGDIRGYTAVAVSLEPGPQASTDAPKGPVIALSSH